jgi:hypothetical protein
MAITLIGLDPTNVYTSAQLAAGQAPFGLGDRGFDNVGNEYVFVQADASGITDRFAAGIRAGFVATMLNTTNSTPGTDGGTVGCMVGAPQGASIPASGAGWLLVRGIGTVRVAASCVRNTLLNTTATAGTLDDDATAGSEQLVGLVITTTATGAANTAAVFNYPTVYRTL